MGAARAVSQCRRNRASGRAAVALLLATLPAGCAADPQAAAKAPGPALACAELALGASAAQPLAAVPVQGIHPSATDTVRVMLTVAGDSASHPVALTYDDSGRAALVVPLHPNGTMGGGAVRLRFAAADAACEPLDFTIAALDRAPGTLRALTTSLHSILDTQLRLLGGSVEELRGADPDTLAPPLVVLHLAQWLLEQQENAAPPPAEGAALTDALLASTGLPEAMHAYEGELRLRLRGTDDRRTARHAPAGVVTLARFGEWAPRLARQAPITGSCPPPTGASFTQPDARTLACWMSLAQVARLGTTGMGKVVFTALSVTLEAGSLIPLPVVPAVYNAAKGTALIYYLQMTAYAGLLPRDFVPGSLDFDLLPGTFREDEEGPGRWENVRIEARSDGWVADEAIRSVLFEAGSFGLLSSAVGSEAVGTIAQGTESRDSSLVFAPQRFGPVDISDFAWSDARISGSAVQHDLAAGRPSYEPRHAGESVIRVWTQPGRFGTSFQEREKTLRVDSIDVAILPPAAQVNAAETVRFRALVTHAIDERLEWRIEPGTVHRLIVAGTDGHTAEVVTSDNEAHFPALLIARSIAERSHLDIAPERVDTARIGLYRLQLDPASGCVSPGDTLRYTVVRPDVVLDGVVLTGGPDPDVQDYRWSASRGSVARPGTFVAPTSGAGTAMVTAVDRAIPELRGEAEVRYGEDCDAYFSYQTRGHLTLSREGPFEGILGIPGTPTASGTGSPELCYLRFVFDPVLARPDHSIHFKAALVGGLREGSYPIGRNFKESPDSDYTFMSPPPWELPNALPGTFFGSFSADVQKHDLDTGYQQGGRSLGSFMSRSGILVIEQFDGKHVSGRFEMNALQAQPDQVETSEGLVHLPRRTVTVTGQFSYAIPERRNINSQDYYTCGGPT